MKLGQLCTNTSEQEGSGQSKGCRLTGKPTRLGWPDGSPVFSCSVRDQTREVQEFLYRELLHRTCVVCSVRLLEDYFLAFVAGFEEQGFNCYYPLGDGRERIQTVIVSLRGRWGDTGKSEWTWEELPLSSPWASFLGPRTTMWFCVSPKLPGI